MEHGGLSQSWRFIELIVTRAKRRRRGCALRKLLPRKNIFTRETKRNPSKTNPEPEEKTNDSEQDRDVEAAVKRRKIDRREFAEVRFIDYRSNGPDLSNKPDCEVVEERFVVERNCTPDANTFQNEKIAILHVT